MNQDASSHVHQGAHLFFTLFAYQECHISSERDFLSLSFKPFNELLSVANLMLGSRAIYKSYKFMNVGVIYRTIIFSFLVDVWPYTDLKKSVESWWKMKILLM